MTSVRWRIWRPTVLYTASIVSLFVSIWPVSVFAQSIDTLRCTVIFPPDTQIVSAALFEPSAIECGPDGNVYILDRGNNRVMVYRPNGTLVKEIGVGTLGTDGLRQPQDLAIADDGRLFIADSDNSRIAIIGHDGKLVGQIPVPFYPDVVAVSHSGRVYTKSEYRTDGNLFHVFTDRGEKLGTWGEYLNHQGSDSVGRAALNRSGLVFGNAGQIALLRDPIAEIQLLDASLRSTKSIVVRGPSISFSREVFHHTWGTQFDSAGVSLMDTSREALIREVLIASHVATVPRSMEFFGDAAFYKDRLFVLTTGMVYVYTLTGTLEKIHCLSDPAGDPIYCDRMAIDSAGQLFSLDGFHSFRCYRFDTIAGR